MCESRPRIQQVSANASATARPKTKASFTHSQVRGRRSHSRVARPNDLMHGKLCTKSCAQKTSNAVRKRKQTQALHTVKCEGGVHTTGSHARMTLCMESFALILLPFWILLVPAAKPWPLSNLIVPKLQQALTNVGRNGAGNYISNARVVLLVDWLFESKCVDRLLQAHPLPSGFLQRTS